MRICHFESDPLEDIEGVCKQYSDFIQWLDCEGGYCDCWFEYEQILDE